MRTLFAFVAALMLAAAATGAAAAEHDQPTRNIVETAVSAGSFETLAAALQAADLVETLQGEGPFTVFAPTDDAFAALPDGTVETLLRPENLDQLRSVLLYHVVPGELDGAEVANRRTLETVGGERVAVQPRIGALFVNESRVMLADVEASNGVIHVIDQVLLPPSLDLAAPAGDESRALLERAISLGAPLYNRGQQEACAAIYDVAVRAVLDLDESLPDGAAQPLQRALRMSRGHHDASDRAWALRRGMDAALMNLRQREMAMGTR